MCLSKAEKKSIAKKNLKTKAHDISDCYDLYDCFPLLCKLYQQNPSLNIKDFFHKTFSVYEVEIDILQKKGFHTKYCALAFCVVFNNNLTEETFTGEVDKETRTIIENTCVACKLDRGTSRLILQDELNSFIHTFMKKEQNIYKTIHDKLFDFLVYYFGQKIIHCLIKNAHSRVIMERLLLEKQDSDDQFISVVPVTYHQMYIQRMIDDWSKGVLIEVLCNINMKIPHFRRRILFHLEGLETTYQKNLAHTCDVRDNVTVLMLLCSYDDISMISWCVNHGVDVNQCSKTNDTALHVAVFYGWIKIVRILLDAGADYNICNSYSWSPVLQACRFGHTEIVKMLLDTGADYNKCHSDGWSPLWISSRYGYTDIVRMLLDTKSDYNKCDSEGWTPFMAACKYSHTETVRMLLDTGADYNKGADSGWSPVIFASCEENTEILKLLLDVGADYNKCDNSGCSPVLFACFEGYTEKVGMLLHKGADYNYCNNEGWTPVMCACINGHTDIVRMLLDIGADYNKCNNEGQSLEIIASGRGRRDMVRVINEYIKKEKARQKGSHPKGRNKRKRLLDSSESDENFPLARLKEQMKARQKGSHPKGRNKRKWLLDSSESNEDVPLARLKEQIKDNALMKKRKRSRSSLRKS